MVQEIIDLAAYSKEKSVLVDSSLSDIDASKEGRVSRGMDRHFFGTFKVGVSFENFSPVGILLDVSGRDDVDNLPKVSKAVGKKRLGIVLAPGDYISKGIFGIRVEKNSRPHAKAHH
jgi:hypothetical protein